MPAEDQCQIFDNGGETFDQYTVWIPEGEIFSVYCLSFNADSPQGVCSYAGELSREKVRSLRLSCGIRISPEDLPEGARRALRRILHSEETSVLG